MTAYSYEHAAKSGEAQFLVHRGLILFGIIQFGTGIGQVVESIFGEKWHNIIGWGCLIGALVFPLLGCVVMGWLRF